MKVLVPISNGTEDMEAVIIIDMLRRAGCEVLVAGDGNVVICARGVRLVPDITIEDINDDETFDAIVFPGGSQGVQNFIDNPTLEAITRKHHKKKGLIGAICAGPQVLHEYGLLPKSQTLTSHPSVASTLAHYTYSLDRVVEDGTIITSRGAGTAFEFSLALIRRLMDGAVAARVSSDIVLYE